MTYCTSSCLRHPPSFDTVFMSSLYRNEDDNNTTSCRHSNVCALTTPSVKRYICQVAGSSVLASSAGLPCARCPVAETSVYRLLPSFSMCVLVGVSWTVPSFGLRLPDYWNGPRSLRLGNAEVLQVTEP